MEKGFKITYLNGNLLNDNNKKLRLGLARQHVNAQRKLWKVTEVVHPSIENFRNRKLP